MAKLDRAALKAFFETGDIPTQSQYVDLIDSLLNFIDDGVYDWKKVTINFDDFQPEVTRTKFIDCFEVPSGFQINRILMLPRTSFTGGLVTQSIITIFLPDDSTEIAHTEIDAFPAITDTTGMISAGQDAFSGLIFDISNPSFARIRCQVGALGPVIDDLTQGSIDVYYRLDKIPF